MKGHRPILDSVDGGVISSTYDANNNRESDLDLQYAMTLTYPLPTTLYQVGDEYIGGSFNTL
jgi:tripeptidyl-peptidase-1